MAEPEPLPESGGPMGPIGPYRIVRALSRGGMGEVFLGRDDRLNRWVAIKRIRHDSDTPLLRQRLLQEAHAAGGLRHPAIVLVYDLLQHAGDDCLVMEYVEGETLAEALRGGPLDPALAVRLAEEVASGLAAAHAAGIIHRDLKAENVMVTPAREAKVLDFGLAKPIGIPAEDPSLTAAGCVVGTSRAMSPEQARGAEIDERSDLFSLGVLLYEMLTASSPFQGPNSLATLTKVISERPPCLDTLRPGLPPRLVALVYGLLAKDPEARPQSAAEVARELAAVGKLLVPSGHPSAEETIRDLPAVEIRRGSSGAVLTIPSTRPAPVPAAKGILPSARRHRLRRAILGSLALAVLAAVALGLRYRAHPKPDLLWVLVLNPPGAGHDAQIRSASTALVRASLRTLGGLRGIAPIGPVLGTPKDVTGATAAEDFLGMTLEPSGDRGIITLSHIRGRDGKVLDDRTFTAPIDARNVRGLEQAVEAPLRSLFSAHPPRDDVSAAGYAEFFEIQQRIEAGQNSPSSELPGLEKLIRRFPGFLDAQSLATYVLLLDPRKPGDHDRALRLIARAKALAPGDPRPLQKEFRVDLEERRWKDAEAALSKMENLAPGDPYNPYFRAALAHTQGRSAEALNAYRKAAKYVPTWRNLSTLAAAEAKLGLVEDARSHLEQVLRDLPGNVAVLRQLAALEFYYGDPARADAIYMEIIEHSPRSQDYAGRGNARVLLQRYADAIQDFEEALKLQPENALVTLELADAELALGEKKQADVLYRKALQRLEGHPVQGGQTLDDEMAKAQCLAYLGRSREALRIVKRSLQQDPDDPLIIVSAAQVFCFAGDYASAVEMARNALAKHVGPDWFKSPIFAPLAKDPRFQQILAEAARGRVEGSPASAMRP